jgi:hypothetical protein
VPFNQDDAREKAMVTALNLQQRADRARHEEDAYLDVESDGQTLRLLFECKSAPEKDSFGTGRDTGTAQLLRWSTMHFVFGWFSPRAVDPIKMWYGAPAMMRRWIESELAYLGPDQQLLGLVPNHLAPSRLVDDLLGAKDEYTYDELRRLMKAQWNRNAARGQANLYRELAANDAKRPADLTYSRSVAERAVIERVEYLLARGSTVNNRKIPLRHVREHCVELHGPRWAQDFYEAVDAALGTEPPPIDLAALNQARQ